MTATVTQRRPLPSLQSRGASLASPASQLELLASVPLVREHADALRDAGVYPLRSTGIRVFQINVGKLCNQLCRHCHVDAGPDRREVMTRETMEQCLAALAKTDIPVVDITGGAPEMNPSFRWLVRECRALGRHVMHRCNLTILETPSHRDLPEFFAEQKLELLCSLPHTRQEGTDRQRGEGVYEKSIRALKRLNEVGYGDGTSGLRLVLVTNPVGAFLPGAQASLEREFKSELARAHALRFDALYVITNMPISRYLEWLETSGNLRPYLQTLASGFNPTAAARSMCRSTLSIGWDGRLHDCEFKQMLDLPTDPSVPSHISEFDLAPLDTRPISTTRACFACTAGPGSSCAGATTGDGAK